MFDRLLAVATPRNLYRSLFVMLAMLVAMNLAAALFSRYTGGVSILDLAGGYTPEAAYHMIAAYGEQGRRYHLLITAADMIFPPSVALFFILLIAYCYARLTRSRAAVQGLLLLPVVYFAADYLENISIAAMLLGFPAAFPRVAVLASALLGLKNLSAGALLAVALIGLGAWLVRRRRGLQTAISE
jgi:hypothetical protein